MVIHHLTVKTVYQQGYIVCSLNVVQGSMVCNIQRLCVLIVLPQDCKLLRSATVLMLLKAVCCCAGTGNWQTGNCCNAYFIL